MKRTVAFEIAWDNVVRRLTIDDADDMGDVLTAFHNLIVVNVKQGHLAADGPWPKLAHELWDLLCTAGYGPHLVLSENSMTVGHTHYPAKPPQ